jgi:hypothetical protein
VENRIFDNLLASRPAREGRWRIWLLVAAAHIVVIGAIVLFSNWSRSDEVIEVFSDPIILEDVEPKFEPLPEPEVKPAPKPESAEPVSSGKATQRR